jgi:hypothetical protein
MGNNDCIAVLTGDLIKYSKYRGDPNQYINYLLDALNSASKRYNFQYQIFRGDSFQGILLQPEVALEVSVFIRSHLLSQPYLRSYIDQEYKPTQKDEHRLRYKDLYRSWGNKYP